MDTTTQRALTRFSFWILIAFLPGVVYAGGPPTREVIVQVEKTASIWVVGAWNFETCRILTPSVDIIPQYEDISALCGDRTTSLMNSGAVTLYYLGEYHYKVDEPQELSPIEIITDFAGGSFIVQATEPLLNYTINKIDVVINGSPTACDDLTGEVLDHGLRCSFPIAYFPVTISTFATSTYGDLSQSYVLRIGNMIQSDTYFSDPEKSISIIGDNAYTQYNLFHDIPRIWGVIPGSDNVPDWVKIVPSEKLVSDQYYYYLAGQILLDTPSAGHNCHDRGISGQYSTNCGVLSVFDDVFTYQNAYNEEITLASNLTGVPNRFIKRIMAVESQFYPNAFGVAGERGLYQFTRDGADTLLRWNGPFYVELCGEYWDYCGTFGYDTLEQWQRDVLINHVLADHNNIYYLASALKANAFQVARILDNVSGVDIPGEVLCYEDLWKITALNYHAGPIVVSAVLVNIRELDLDISWESFAIVLTDLQPSALHYVNRVYKGY